MAGILTDKHWLCGVCACDSTPIPIQLESHTECNCQMSVNEQAQESDMFKSKAKLSCLH